MSLFVNNKILDLLMLFSEAGGCSKHFFGVRCSFGHPMEGFQSFFPNFVTHQILLCTPKLKRPKRNQAKFPNLIILVKKYLCIQASSTEAERSFSALANLLTKRRLRMSGENVNKQLFLREAIKKLCLLKSLS